MTKRIVAKDFFDTDQGTFVRQFVLYIENSDLLLISQPITTQLHLLRAVLLLVEKLEEDLGAVECLKNLIIRQKILDSGTL